jgi:hypothetical protein
MLNMSYVSCTSVARAESTVMAAEPLSETMEPRTFSASNTPATSSDRGRVLAPQVRMHADWNASIAVRFCYYVSSRSACSLPRVTVDRHSGPMSQLYKYVRLPI